MTHNLDMTADELFEKILEGFRNEIKFMLTLRETLNDLFLPSRIEECWKRCAEDLMKESNDNPTP